MGYTRLRGALKNLGHEIGRNTIKRLLAEHGIAPAPERGYSADDKTLLHNIANAVVSKNTNTLPSPDDSVTLSPSSNRTPR